ncbi:unnamed protein product [Pleuronectes platessa]|uniref:Uncharacterized protein n=1 Tax=Pleuronectes platessa TaxID=8262 RepID=A0A9N7VGV3_PLEPL|nr:unnamed protein product [Pleuronectes platessa]
MCCLHGLPSQPDPSKLDKSKVEDALYTSRVQPAHISPPLHQSQQLQRCWDTESSSHRPPPKSPVPFVTPVQLTCGRGATSLLQATDSQPYSQSKSYLSYHPHQREVPPGSQVPLSADCSRSGQCQGKLSISTALQQELSRAAVDRDVMTEESWEERCRVEETCGHAATGESRELLDEELQQDRAEQGPASQQQQHCAPPAAELRKEQQRTRPSLTLGDHRDGRRSTSLEVPATAHDGVSDVPSSRLSPSSACARRTRRSQSIPAELAAPSTSPHTERPTGWTHAPEAGKKYADPRQRRASDGVLCVVKETSSDMALPRSHRYPLLSYKTEPDHCFTYVDEEIDCEAKEKCRLSRNGHNSNGDVHKDSARPRVPVVCLERLKILVSRLPPHGRRQSDPLPAGSMERSETLPQQKLWHDANTQRLSGGSEIRRTSHSFTAPLYAAERQTRNQSTAQSTNSEFESRGRLSSRKASTPPSTDPNYASHSYSPLDLDSDSYLKSLSDDVAFSPADPDPQIDSDTSPPDSDPNAESSSEAELGDLAEEISEAAGDMGPCSDTEIAGGSEPSLEYDEDPESEGEVGSEDGQGLDADAETESDVQPEYVPRFQVETDSNVASDQPPDSQESELDVESEAEFTTDEPQPLRSDLEEESSPIGPGLRSLLIANPLPLRGTDDIQSEQDEAEMESEDFCAVCLIGGDLLCCDRCPKVFHLSCHVPSLLTFPTGDWVCSLCRDALQPEVEYDCENERTSGEHTVAHGLPASDQRKSERLTLLILSNVLSSPFHEPVSPLAHHYYQIIKRPMDLSVIRARLQKRNALHYNSADQLVADFHLMFRNCAKFNYPDSEVAQAGRSLVAYFNSKLKEVFPDRVFSAAEADSDSDDRGDNTSNQSNIPVLPSDGCRDVAELYAFF